MPLKATLDSARTEEFVPLVPHRLPLPPLLASQVPALTTDNPSASRPQPRLKLQAKAAITAVEPPMLQSTMPLVEMPTEIDKFLQQLDARGRETVNHLQTFCEFNTDKLKELQELKLACARGERPLAEALALFNMGIEYESAGRHERASELFLAFLAPCQRAGYTPGLITGLSALQVSYYLQQDYREVINAGEQGIKKIEEASRIAEQTSGGWLTQSLMASSFLLNTALAFLEMFDYEGATLSLSRALQHALQTGDRTAEAAINAAQAACNALSGDFAKADSCLDRYVELAGIKEVGLEGALGLKSVKAGFGGAGTGAMGMVHAQDGYLVENRPSPSVLQKQMQLSGLFLRIANLARFHGDLQKSFYYATRGYNLARRSGLQGLTASCACAMGIASADQIQNEAQKQGAPDANTHFQLPEVKIIDQNFQFDEITI